MHNRIAHSPGPHQQLYTLLRNEALKVTKDSVSTNRVSLKTAAKHFEQPKRARARQKLEMFYLMYKDVLDPIITATAAEWKAAGKELLPPKKAKAIPDDDGEEERSTDDEEESEDEEEDEDEEHQMQSQGVSDGVGDEAGGDGKCDGDKTTKMKAGWMLRLRQYVFSREWALANEEVQESVHRALALEREAVADPEDPLELGLDRAPEARQE